MMESNFRDEWRMAAGSGLLLRLLAALRPWRLMRSRPISRRELRHLLELDDYLLEDMGLPRGWFIAERHRRGLAPEVPDMSGRPWVYGCARRRMPMRDGFW